MGINYEKLKAKLKEKGISSYKIRNEKIISEGTMTSIRNNKYIDLDILERLCLLLDCQLSDLVTITPDIPDKTTDTSD